MPLPAILAGIGSALSNPTFLSIVAGALPSVISALTGSPTETEARTKVKPQRDAMLAKLIAQGLDTAEAEKLADESIAGEVQRLQNEGGIPPWLEGALSVGAGLLGWKAGTWLRGGGAAKAAAAAPAVETATNSAAKTQAIATAKPAQMVDESGPTLTGPFPKNSGRDPAATMHGGSDTSAPTMGMEDVATRAEIPAIRNPFAWADEVVEGMPKRNPMQWADEAAARAAAPPPYVPSSRPIDPLTGAPRAPRGRTDPTTGMPMPTEEVRPIEIQGPFPRGDTYTGGASYSTGEQRALAASELRRQRDENIRRSGMGMASKDDAVRRAQQMEEMRALDEIQRQRGAYFPEID